MCLLLVSSGGASAQDFDILIRGGRIVDGTGNPAFPGDIGIRKDRIVAMGRLSGQQRRALSTPRVLQSRPVSSTSTIIPILDVSRRQRTEHDPAGRHVHDSSAKANPPRLSAETGPREPGGAEWTDFNGYFARLLRQGISTNVGTYVGSGQIWTYVHGEKAGPPTAPELDADAAPLFGRPWSKARWA